jgi:hypothetical protein
LLLVHKCIRNTISPPARKPTLSSFKTLPFSCPLPHLFLHPFKKLPLNIRTPRIRNIQPTFSLPTWPRWKNKEEESDTWKWTNSSRRPKHWISPLTLMMKLDFYFFLFSLLIFIFWHFSTEQSQLYWATRQTAGQSNTFGGNAFNCWLQLVIYKRVKFFRGLVRSWMPKEFFH